MTQKKPKESTFRWLIREIAAEEADVERAITALRSSLISFLRTNAESFGKNSPTEEQMKSFSTYVVTRATSVFIKVLVKREAPKVGMRLARRWVDEQLETVAEQNNMVIMRSGEQDGEHDKWTLSIRSGARDKLPRFLYHVAPSHLIDAIMRDGLLPHSTGDYEPRVYVTTSAREAVNMAEWLGHSTEYGLFKINAKSLNGAKFFDDVEAGEHSLWTTAKIPPSSIELVKTFNV